MHGSVLPPETVFHWRLEGLHADDFEVGSDVEWTSPSFLACGLQWRVCMAPDVLTGDGGRYAGIYLYLETPDATVWPAVAEIAVEGSPDKAQCRLLRAPFSTKKPAPDDGHCYSRNWGHDKMISHWALMGYFGGFNGTVVVRVRLRARSFQETDVPSVHRSVGTFLSDDLASLLGDEAHKDVHFCFTGGETVGAHSILLAARSATLRALLHGPLASKLPATLHVPDCISAAIMARLVRFIYTDEVCFDSVEEAQHLLYAADYYDIMRLRTLCERELHASLSMGNALDTLVLAHACNCVALRSTALRFVAQHAAEVLSSKGWASVREAHPELEGALMHTVAHGEPPPRVVAREPGTPLRCYSSPESTPRKLAGASSS